MNSSVVDVWIMLAMGLIGYDLRKLDFETAPIVLGVVLAPMIEMSLRQSLAMSDGQWGIFLGRPIAATLLAVGAALVLFPIATSIRRSLDWRGRLALADCAGCLLELLNETRALLAEPREKLPKPCVLHVGGGGAVSFLTVAARLDEVIEENNQAKARKKKGAEFEPHLWYFARKLLKGLAVVPPGYTSARSIARIDKALKKFLLFVETRRQVEEGAYAIVGSPATVRDKLQHYIEKLGVGNLLGLFQIGTLPAELTKKNLTIFAKEVMPALQNLRVGCASQPAHP